jgi:TPR repeat protein/AcrR family transcriptional regulator
MADEKTNTAEKQDFVRRRRPARRAILEVARRILLRDGSDALTPEAVVKETGLSAEIVYAYFCNKDELLLAIASDELSIIARNAKEGGESAEEDGTGIRELPRMVEGFIAARAFGIEKGSEQTATENSDSEAETQESTDDSEMSAETQSEGDEEISLEDALSADGDEDAEKKSPEFAVETLRRDVPRSRRRPNQGREIDGIVREVAGSDQQGEAAVSAIIARLERRLYLIERSMAEAAEKAEAEARKVAETPRFSNEDIGALVARVTNLEKRLADILEDISAGHKTTLERLRILEATPPAGPSAAERVPATEEVVVEAGESDQTESTDDSTVELRDSSLEAFLSAARQAAKSASEEADKTDDDENSLIVQLKQRAVKLIARVKGMDRKTLLTKVVPIPLVIIGLGVTIWAAMNAGEIAATTDGDSNQPGTVVAMSMNAAPQITLSPIDELTAGAESGNVNAQAALGLAYLNGDGVEANEVLALPWLQLAAENGQAVAEYNLASLYAREDNAMYDPMTAKYWFQTSAEKGNRMAMNNLAMFYAQGLGTDADIAEAAHWFSMAAALDFQVAQYNLAVLYETGQGVPPDVVQAYKWYALAAGQGDADARARIAILSEKMDPDTLSEAEAEFESFEAVPLDPASNDAPSFPRSRT